MRRVLLIEDDADLRLLMAEVLELDGFEVVQSAEFGHARQALGAAAFDLVIADLPEGGRLDDLQCLGLYRQDAPLLICTGCPRAGAMDPIDFGAAEIIMKPFDMDALLEAARTHARAMGQASLGVAWTSSPPTGSPRA